MLTLRHYLVSQSNLSGRYPLGRFNSGNKLNIRLWWKEHWISLRYAVTDNRIGIRSVSALYLMGKGKFQSQSDVTEKAVPNWWLGTGLCSCLFPCNYIPKKCVPLRDSTHLDNFTDLQFLQFNFTNGRKQSLRLLSLHYVNSCLINLFLVFSLTDHSDISRAYLSEDYRFLKFSKLISFPLYLPIH